MSSKDDIENENENDKTLTSSKDDIENENDNDKILMSSNEDDDDERMDQNKKNKKTKDLNTILDEIIDKSKSFEKQIKLLKKIKGLKGNQYSNDYGDKELKFKYFKTELVDMSNEIDKKVFKQIFGHTLETLANKLINTTNKEENEIIVKNINESKEKLYEMNPFHNFVIQPSNRHINLIDTIRLILDFNETV